MKTIKVPQQVLNMGRHRLTNGFIIEFNKIRSKYDYARQAYRHLEAIHLEYFGETRYKNFETFWRAWLRETR